MSQGPHTANTSRRRPQLKQRYTDRPQKSQAQLAHLEELVKQGPQKDSSRTYQIPCYRSRRYCNEVFTVTLDPKPVASDIAYKRPLTQGNPFARPSDSNQTNDGADAHSLAPRLPRPFNTSQSIPLGSNLYTCHPIPPLQEQTQIQYDAHSRPPDSVEDRISSEIHASPQRTEGHLESSSAKLPATEIDTPASWSFASQTLINGPRGRELAHLEDCLSEDIPIRAILYGWGALGEAWELPPFWRIIRALDENLFHYFGPMERLAMFRMIHLLIRFHSDPTPDRAASLPPFFNSKGIDFVGNDYICNFLSWPGVRALAKNPRHAVRSNRFFDLEKTNLTFLWPFSVQECCTRSPDTGLLKFAPEFDERFFDINAYTFKPEMFEVYPELRSVCRPYSSIPGAVPRRRVKAKSHGESSWSNNFANMVEQCNAPTYGELVWHYDFQDGRRVPAYFTFW